MVTKIPLSLIIVVGVLTISGCVDSVPRGDQSVPGKAPPSIFVAPDPSGPELAVIPRTAKITEKLSWKLMRLDSEFNRVYLSSGGSKSSCTTPIGTQLVETSTTVTIDVIAETSASPCTMRKVTLRGYVQLDAPLAGRSLSGQDG